ncbi:MarR family winged helix-turn-helix transcriptional regulator [Pseudogracilibacillus sp. SO30301A]|uniref:MarR family winged helix-turn-helix transcriptional regulator n=1 Tax=Pseudogracilibacillus sp. SO30301A TaxID=3098291 RepID=UPI00300E01E9
MSDNTNKNDEELSLKLFVVLSRAIESVRKQVVKDIKSYQLNLTEFGVMEFLYHKGEQPIQLIGKKVLLASSSITYVVDKLEEKGYLERIACPNDRRVIYGRLTEKGKKLMEEIFPQHKKAMAKIFSSLSKNEKEQAIELLKKIGIFAESI